MPVLNFLGNELIHCHHRIMILVEVKAKVVVANFNSRWFLSQVLKNTHKQHGAAHRVLVLYSVHTSYLQYEFTIF